MKKDNKKIMIEKIADLMVKDTLAWIVSSSEQFSEIRSVADRKDVNPIVAEIIKAYSRKINNIKKNIALVSPNGDYSSDNIIHIIFLATSVVASRLVEKGE